MSRRGVGSSGGTASQTVQKRYHRRPRNKQKYAEARLRSALVRGRGGADRPDRVVLPASGEPREAPEKTAPVGEMERGENGGQERERSPAFSARRVDRGREIGRRVGAGERREPPPREA